MKTKVVWMGLLAFGVADWLVINLVVGPRWIGSPADDPGLPAVAQTAIPSSQPQVDPPKARATAVAVTSTARAPEPPAASAAPAPAVASEEPQVPAEQPSPEPVLFAPQSAVLGEDARKELHRVAARMNDHPGTLLIEGHADRRGTDAFNEWLSMQRAAAVRAHLQSLGVRAARMKVAAHGSTRPVDTSHTEAARARNRRVELTFE